MLNAQSAVDKEASKQARLARVWWRLEFQKAMRFQAERHILDTFRSNLALDLIRLIMC